jgi:hypothetical protein
MLVVGQTDERHPIQWRHSDVEAALPIGAEKGIQGVPLVFCAAAGPVQFVPWKRGSPLDDLERFGHSLGHECGSQHRVSRRGRFPRLSKHSCIQRTPEAEHPLLETEACTVCLHGEEQSLHR